MSHGPPDPTPLQRALTDFGCAQAFAPGDVLEGEALREVPMVLVTHGALLVERCRHEARSAEVLGAGEALAGLGCAGVRALLPTRAYVLRSLQVVAQRHPDVAARITGALLRQQGRHADLLSLSHLPRADARVLGLLELLAERFGTRTPTGIRVDLPLRHADIGHLVGGRRPTITTAIADLEHAGRLWREAGTGRFVLPSDTAAPVAAEPVRASA